MTLLSSVFSTPASSDTLQRQLEQHIHMHRDPKARKKTSVMMLDISDAAMSENIDAVIRSLQSTLLTTSFKKIVFRNFSAKTDELLQRLLIAALEVNVQSVRSMKVIGKPIEFDHVQAAIRNNHFVSNFSLPGSKVLQDLQHNVAQRNQQPHPITGEWFAHAALQNPMTLHLSAEVIDRYRYFIKLVQAISNIQYPQLSDESPQTLEVSQAIFVTQLLQLLHRIDFKSPATHVTQAAFSYVQHLITVCGLRNPGGHRPPLRTMPDHFQPIRNSFAAKHIQSSWREFSALMHPRDRHVSLQNFRVAEDFSQRGWQPQSKNQFSEFTAPITFLDLEIALQHISANEVSNAELFIDVNTPQLTQFVTAMTDNSSLRQLTLHLHGDITPEIALTLSQIFRRNDAHMSSLYLPNAEFAKGALEKIREAIAVNGSLINFTCPRDNASRQELDKIRELLQRNQQLRFTPRQFTAPVPWIGFTVAIVFGAAIATMFPPVLLTKAVLLTATAGFLAITVGAMLLEQFIRHLIARHYENNTIAPNVALHQARIAQQQSPITVYVRHHQYQEVCKEFAALPKPPFANLVAKPNETITQVSMSSAQFGFFAQARAQQTLLTQLPSDNSIDNRLATVAKRYLDDRFSEFQRIDQAHSPSSTACRNAIKTMG